MTQKVVGGGNRAEVEGSKEGMQKDRSGGEVQPKVGRGERPGP
jgi:hypothetical protein